MLTPKDKTNILPTTPGVYQFYDKTGKILYIGKAKNLRSRVKSYFLRAEELTESRSTAIYQMVQKIKRIKNFLVYLFGKPRTDFVLGLKSNSDYLFC